MTDVLGNSPGTMNVNLSFAHVVRFVSGSRSTGSDTDDYLEPVAKYPPHLPMQCKQHQSRYVKGDDLQRNKSSRRPFMGEKTLLCIEVSAETASSDFLSV